MCNVRMYVCIHVYVCTSGYTLLYVHTQLHISMCNGCNSDKAYVVCTYPAEGTHIVCMSPRVFSAQR